jgi:hypothetical protein
VASTEVTVNGKPASLTGGRLVLEPGDYTVAYRSTDTAGNTERWSVARVAAS